MLPKNGHVGSFHSVNLRKVRRRGCDTKYVDLWGLKLFGPRNLAVRQLPRGTHALRLVPLHILLIFALIPTLIFITLCPFLHATLFKRSNPLFGAFN